jgi:hypothetical protein
MFSFRDFLSIPIWNAGTNRSIELVVICVMALTLFFVPSVTRANELPDSPQPKVQSSRPNKPPKPAVESKYWDKHTKIAFGTTVTLLAFDSAQTCNNLMHGGHEDFLPTQKCGPAVAMMAAQDAALWLASYWAHRHSHHKIEHILQWYGPADNAVAIGYSKKNGAW